LRIKEEKKEFSLTDYSQATNLSDLIGYQGGAVVSRTLVNKKTGTVTLFSFDAGQGLSEHTAPYDALVYVVEGVTDVTISGNTQRLSAGDVVVMPANEPHALHGVQAFKMLLVMIKSGE
jgi:quercetin dioxygenase-like cupin family protein